MIVLPYEAKRRVIAGARGGKSWLNFYLLELRVLAWLAALTPEERESPRMVNPPFGPTGRKATAVIPDELQYTDQSRRHRHYTKERWT